MKTTTTWNYATISQKAVTLLRQLFPTDTLIDTEVWNEGKVLIKIVSIRLNGISDGDKQKMIWNYLRQHMQANAQGIALIIAYGTDQL